MTHHSTKILPKCPESVPTGAYQRRQYPVRILPSSPLYMRRKVCHAYDMHIVLDTNVLYAGIRSSRGASRIILELLVEGHLTAVLAIPS